MRRTTPRTETLSCDGSPPQTPDLSKETAFEKQRGVSLVETRGGFCQVHVFDLSQPLMAQRLYVLRAVAESDISIDFMKLTPAGMSFLAPQELSKKLEATLEDIGVAHSIRNDRAIVMVHAVNIRDEEGLIAEIVQSAISAGAQIDHIGDGHDRLLLVVAAQHVERIASHFERSLITQPKRKAS